LVGRGASLWDAEPWATSPATRGVDSGRCWLCAAGLESKAIAGLSSLLPADGSARALGMRRAAMASSGDARGPRTNFLFGPFPSSAASGGRFLDSARGSAGWLRSTAVGFFSGAFAAGGNFRARSWLAGGRAPGSSLRVATGRGGLLEWFFAAWRDWGSGCVDGRRPSSTRGCVGTITRRG
jgi:hypothetical protein